MIQNVNEFKSTEVKTSSVVDGSVLLPVQFNDDVLATTTTQDVRKYEREGFRRQDDLDAILWVSSQRTVSLKRTKKRVERLLML